MEQITIKFSFLSGEGFELTVPINYNLIRLISIIDEYTPSRLYSFIYDGKEIDIYDKITKYYSVERDLSINIIMFNMFYHISNFNCSRITNEDMQFLLYSIIPFDLDHIVLTNIDYSCNGVPILVNVCLDFCQSDKIKYGCRCVLFDDPLNFHMRGINVRNCQHDNILEMKINPSSICCDIFKLQFSNLCKSCKNNLIDLLINIRKILYHTFSSEQKILRISRNELFENFIIRFEKILK